jgi:hypothetical protein
VRLRWVSGYAAAPLASFRDARLVGLGRLAGGLGHLTQLWISGVGFGCFLGVLVSSLGWWGGGQVGRCACGFAPALPPMRAENTRPGPGSSAEWNPLIREKPRMNGAPGQAHGGSISIIFA